MTIVAHQAGALGVPMKVHTQKSTGKAVTGSMDAYNKLQTARAEYGTLSREDANEIIAGLDLRADKIAEGIDQGKATLEAMKESLDPRIAKLTELIPRTKEGGGELSYITKGKYQKVWGKIPPASIVTGGGKVRWEYALDTIAQELHLEPKAQAEGKHPDEYLKGLIEDAKEQKESIRATGQEIATDEATLKAIDKLKGSIKDKIGTTTTTGVLESLAKPNMPFPEKVALAIARVSKPDRRAVKMLASEAQALINKVQAKRSTLAVATDRGKLAVQVVPMSKAGLWAKNPNRFDIRRVDTPHRGRIKAGVAYADGKRSRLSRIKHRGFQRIKYT